MNKNFNADLGTNSIVYSTIIPKELLLSYKKWADSKTNKNWILFCNLCERADRKPLEIQKLIIGN